MKKEYKVYQFEHIDNLEHLINPSEVFKDSVECVKFIEEVFKKNGWEGDGEIKLIWLPPFLFDNADTQGQYIWHVKQDNNGTSFIAFENGSIVDSFFELYKSKQNGVYFLSTEFMSTFREVTPTFTDSFSTIKRLEDFKLILKKCKKENDEELLNFLIIGVHSQIITRFFDMLDHYYLNFIDIPYTIGSGEKLKFSKTSPRIDLEKNYINDEVSEFSIKTNIVTALWNNFKFQSFEEKRKELLKIIGLNKTDIINNEVSVINKHIEIRNSFQHREGKFDKVMSDNLGLSQIELLDEKNTNKIIKKWDAISLTINECYSFIESIISFIKKYELQVKNKILTRELIDDETYQELSKYNSDLEKCIKKS